MLLKFVLALTTGNLFQIGFWHLFDMQVPLFFGALFKFLALQDGLSCIFLSPALRSAISPWSPGSFIGEWLKTKIWVVDVLAATGLSLLLSYLSGQSYEIYVCILTNLYIHNSILYISIYIHIKINMSSC